MTKSEARPPALGAPAILASRDWNRTGGMAARRHRSSVGSRLDWRRGAPRQSVTAPAARPSPDSTWTAVRRPTSAPLQQKQAPRRWVRGIFMRRLRPARRSLRRELRNRRRLSVRRDPGHDGAEHPEGQREGDGRADERRPVRMVATRTGEIAGRRLECSCSWRSYTPFPCTRDGSAPAALRRFAQSRSPKGVGAHVTAITLQMQTSGRAA